MDEKCVWDFEALQDNGQQNIRDTISQIYLKILKINLTADTFQTIMVAADEMETAGGYADTLSQWFRKFAEAGFVNELDLKAYQSFCDLDYLREQFKNGNQSLCFHYRRKIKGQFRWVAVELVRGREYREDNQIVYLYVKDIHDPYLRQLDWNVRKNMKNALSMVQLDLTANTYQAGCGEYANLVKATPKSSADAYLERLASFIPKEKTAGAFRKKINRENLLSLFENGETTVTFVGTFLLDLNKRSALKFTVFMERDPLSGNVGAVIYTQDRVEAYLQYIFTPMLYQSNFQTVGIIDLRHKTIALPRKDGDEPSQLTYFEVPYDEARQRVCREKVAPADREDYLSRTALENLRKKLTEDEGYGFLTYYAEDGEERVKSYQFHYLSEEFDLLIVTIEDVTTLSEKDALTGGVNQQGFIRKVEKLLEKQGPESAYGILCLDIKNFKAINELFGILAGNELLKQLYRDLESSFLEPLLTARGEADQYLCLLEWDKLDLEKLTSWCETDYLIKDRPFRVSKRCGIYQIRDHAIAVRRMCDRAKLAMSIAKGEHSPKPYVVFDDTMSEAYIDQSEILGRFDSSLLNGEFCVYLQPVVDPASGRISSAEALVRWNYEQKGVISPQHFIPVLEGSGDISQLDLYVARKVERFQNQRERQGLPVVPISINLSWTDFYDNALLEWLYGYVESRKHKNHTIRFEVTETSYAAVVENQHVLFSQIRQHGAELLLDDFGSGYSSFSTLQNYDFDILKIDMGFVRRIGKCDKTKSIIDSIIKMAHQMDARTVAEGAETQEQVEFLRERGCDYIQGYYFYKPMTMETFAALLDDDQE